MGGLSNLPAGHSPCRVPELDPNLSRETLSKLYRFAVLLAGSPVGAEWMLARVFEEFSTQIGQFRTEKHRTAFLVSKIRECASISPKTEPGSPEGEGEQGQLAGRFSALSEPSKSALALFYLNLFPVAELASLLNLEIEDLGGLLRAGRAQLAATTSATGGEPAK